MISTISDHLDTAEEMILSKLPPHGLRQHMGLVLLGTHHTITFCDPSKARQLASLLLEGAEWLEKEHGNG